MTGKIQCISLVHLRHGSYQSNIDFQPMLDFDSLGFFRYAIYRNRREMTVQVIRAAHQVNANIRAIDASAPYKAVHLL